MIDDDKSLELSRLIFIEARPNNPNAKELANAYIALKKAERSLKDDDHRSALKFYTEAHTTIRRVTGWHYNGTIKKGIRILVNIAAHEWVDSGCEGLARDKREVES